MDNTSYHFAKAHTIPLSRSTKKHLVDWLRSRDVLVSESFLTAQLVHQVDKQKATLPGLKQCRVDAVAKCKGHVVLRLPPYHRELNPT